MVSLSVCAFECVGECVSVFSTVLSFAWHDWFVGTLWPDFKTDNKSSNEFRDHWISLTVQMSSLKFPAEPELPTKPLTALMWIDMGWGMQQQSGVKVIVDL